MKLTVIIVASAAVIGAAAPDAAARQAAPAPARAAESATPAAPFPGFAFATELPMPVDLQSVVSPDVYQDAVFEAQRRALAAQIEQLRGQLPGIGAHSTADLQSDLERVRLAVARAQEEAGQRIARPFRFELRSGGNAYTAGLDALQRRQYADAIQLFDRAIAADARPDGALYWKAFAEYKLGRTDDALKTIATLRRDHAKSRYITDAAVLETDLKRSAGQPVNPASVNDDDIKLLAIQGLQRSEQAIPLLEGVLGSTNSLSVKRRALYVLALNEDARARAILLRYASGEGNPDLQIEAIRYLTSRRDRPELGAELQKIYRATPERAVRFQILDAFRSLDDKRALMMVASAPNTGNDIRVRAVTNVSTLATPTEIWSLYEKEPDAALRAQIATVLGSMHAVGELNRIARADGDPVVRRRAVSALAAQRGAQAADARQALVDLYGSQTDVDVRRTVISALTDPDDASALVSLARKESDLTLKTEIVKRLSDLAPHSKVAADYLMEIIK